MLEIMITILSLLFLVYTMIDSILVTVIFKKTLIITTAIACIIT